MHIIVGLPNISNAFFTLIPSFHHFGNAASPLVVCNDNSIGNAVEAVSGEDQGQNTTLFTYELLEADLSENLQFS
jgi:hypothetical protein